MLLDAGTKFSDNQSFVGVNNRYVVATNVLNQKWYSAMGQGHPLYIHMQVNQTFSSQVNVFQIVPVLCETVALAPDPATGGYLAELELGRSAKLTEAELLAGSIHTVALSPTSQVSSVTLQAALAPDQPGFQYLTVIYYCATSAALTQGAVTTWLSLDADTSGQVAPIKNTLIPDGIA